jgi:hypothetical protein
LDVCVRLISLPKNFPRTDYFLVYRAWLVDMVRGTNR